MHGGLPLIYLNSHSSNIIDTVLSKIYILDLLGTTYIPHALDTGREGTTALLLLMNDLVDDEMVTMGVIVMQSLVQTSPIPAQELGHSGGQGCSLRSTVHACYGWYCD